MWHFLEEGLGFVKAHFSYTFAFCDGWPMLATQGFVEYDFISVANPLVHASL